MIRQTERLSPLHIARDLRDDGTKPEAIASDVGLTHELILLAARRDLQLSRFPLDFEAIRIAMVVLAATPIDARAA